MHTVAPTEAPVGAPARARRRADLLTAFASLVLAVWVTGGMWLDPNGRAILVNSGDQALFEWLLAYGAHAVRAGENPLFTHLLNVPDGVNLAVNTSITALAVVVAPLTWLAGPSVSFLVILTVNLAATAYAWYWLFSRYLHASAQGAAIGGLFAGFSPGLVSHANAHLNWTAQWLMVLIVWATLRLRHRGRTVLRGATLGLLVAAGFSVAAEALFFTALALGIALGVWAAGRREAAREAARPFLTGIATAAVTAGALLAYPLWLHFAGPQRYSGIGFDQRIHSEDLAAFGAYPMRSLAGLAGLDTRLAPNPTEETTFYGVPLLLVTIVCFVALWRAADPARRAALRALGVTALVFAVLALGPRLKWFGDITGIRLPYVALANLPMFDAALPARLALVVTPIIGLLLAWTIDGVRDGARRWLWTGALAVALVPLLPVPLLTTERAPVPHFFTSGAWRSTVSTVDGGATVVPVPLPSDLLPDGQRWQAAALARRDGVFGIPAGFFLGPGGPDRKGRIGPVPRPTALLLHEVARTGVVPAITDADRARAREDLAYWHADVVVLADDVFGAKWPTYPDALLRVTTDLLGPPERVDDVWLWRVRS